MGLDKDRLQQDLDDAIGRADTSAESASQKFADTRRRMQPIVEALSILETQVLDVPDIEISSGEGAVIVVVRIDHGQDAEDRITVIWNALINRYTIDVSSIDYDGASSGNVDYVITPGEVIARLTEAIAGKASTWRRWKEKFGNS